MSKIMMQTLRSAKNIHSFICQPRRNFITLPGSEPQSLFATRILPYSSSSVYTLIADVDSYSSFLPYCLESKVTKRSSTDQNGRTWPSEADLKIGWGGYEETFTSRVLCVPGSIVEALGGEAATSLPQADIEHHSSTSNGPTTANNIFKTITTRWSLKPFHYKPPSGSPQSDNATHPTREQTEVHLSLDFQFSNPVYAALSMAVAPKVAGMMIEAFEARARKLLDGPGANLPGQSTVGNRAFAQSKKYMGN